MQVLCQALFLTLHDLFENGIWYGHSHSETLSPDVKDTDHGAPAAPQEKKHRMHPLREPSPEVLVNEPEIVGGDVLDYEINTDLQAKWHKIDTNVCTYVLFFLFFFCADI